VKPNIYISKYKDENFLVTELKRKKGLPGPGAHDINPKAEMQLTKGLARGWK
jgi:hypothetical protein